MLQHQSGRELPKDIAAKLLQLNAPRAQHDGLQLHPRVAQLCYQQLA
jgi:hypothetical protein